MRRIVLFVLITGILSLLISGCFLGTEEPFDDQKGLSSIAMARQTA